VGWGWGGGDEGKPHPLPPSQNNSGKIFFHLKKKAKKDIRNKWGRFWGRPAGDTMQRPSDNARNS